MKRVPQSIIVATLAIFFVFSISFTHTKQALGASLPADFSCSTIPVNLQKNDSGTAVKKLQIILNLSPDTAIATTGTGSAGNENGRFGQLTYLAVIKFQNKYTSAILTPIGLTTGTGFVGTTTRIQLAKVCAAALSTNTTAANTATSNPNTFVSIGSAITQSASATLALINQKMIKLYSDLYYYTHPRSAEAEHTTPIAPVAPAPTTISATPSPTISTTNTTQTKTVVATPPTTTPVPKTTIATPPPPKPVTTVVQTTPTIPPVTTPVVSVPVLSTGSMQWGAYVGDDIGQVATFESLAGKPVNIVGVFLGFSDSFPTSYAGAVGAKGKTLLVFWEPEGGYDTIISGSEDADMKAFAAGAKSYGYPVILAPFNEMNLNQEAWGYKINGNTAAKFQTAWKRMHDIFVAAGANNVKFAIDYNNNSDPDVSGNQFADYYPGDSYVDYVGIDGFNFGGPWETSSQLFDSAMVKISSFGKPIYILSTASASGSGKAAWITDFGARIKTYPRVIGWVWFNINKEADWRINSDPASLQAFKAILP